MHLLSAPFLPTLIEEGELNEEQKTLNENRQRDKHPALLYFIGHVFVWFVVVFFFSTGDSANLLLVQLSEAHGRRPVTDAARGLDGVPRVNSTMPRR